MTTAVVAYTQADLDADIAAITDSIEDIIEVVGRIKGNWASVQSLHPGVTAVEYIRDHVPYLNKHTAAAVALVESGTTTVSDAARLTGRGKATVSRGVAASPVVPERNNAKPTTLATGKKAPGRAIGTPAPVRAKPVATPKPPRAVPALVMTDEWDKVLQAISIILAAQDDHVIAALNTKDEAQRKAGAALMRSAAIRLNAMRKEVNL